MGWNRQEAQRQQRTPLLVLIFLTSWVLPSTSQLFAQSQPANDQLAKKVIEEGIDAYLAQRYQEAVTKLTQARSLKPSHSSTALYLGLAHLRLGQTDQAIAVWEEYSKLQPYTEEERSGDLQNKITDYLKVLAIEDNRRRAREAVEREKELGPGDPGTIAVTYFDNLSSISAPTNLRKGFAALLISDISQVQELTVVERDFLQAILEEKQLSTTGGLTGEQVPEVGRLVGAGKVTTGSFTDDRTQEDGLQINSLIAETTTLQEVGQQEASGQIAQLLDLEKRLAVAMLNDLGYDEERLRTAGVLAKIQKPHTTSEAAFEAFSDGLEAKDRGDYAAARQHFERALADDPNFEEAERELNALPIIILTGGISAVIAATQASIPSSTAATAGMAAATVAGISPTTVAIGAVVAAGVGAGVGISEATSGGGGDDNPCGNMQLDEGEICDTTDTTTASSSSCTAFQSCVPPEGGDSACMCCSRTFFVQSCIAEPRTEGVFDIRLDVGINNDCPAVQGISSVTVTPRLSISGRGPCVADGASFTITEENMLPQIVATLECFPITTTLTVDFLRNGDLVQSDEVNCL